MATFNEENGWVVFLQTLAVALSSLVDQVSPEDRTMQNFQRLFDGHLEVILADPSANSPPV